MKKIQAQRPYDNIYVTFKKKAKPIYMLEIGLLVPLGVDTFITKPIKPLIYESILLLSIDCFDGQERDL